jgi:ABC-type bacteriocin/lantibiotic exporter with double-glycine peptidase domain
LISEKVGGMIRVIDQNSSAAFLALCLLTSCSAYMGDGHPFSTEDAADDPGWVLVDDVPFCRQSKEYDCGAAAMAMLLNYWSVQIEPKVILEAIPPRTGAGISAGQLQTCAQQHGLAAYLIKGTEETLKRHLSRKRPLLVGLVKPHLGNRQVLHYELVVGIHPLQRKLVTLDPARGKQVYSMAGFQREWEPANNLVLVAAPSATDAEENKSE